MRNAWLAVTLVAAGCRAQAGALPFEAAEADWANGDAGAAAESNEASRSDAARPEGAGGAEAATAPSAEGCGAELVTLAEIHSGRVRGGVRISVGALVASSQKFLVSEAKSGSCLWGAFAGERGKQGAGSGLFLVSFGAPHAEGEACVPGSDGLPDDLKPGDMLEAEGELDEYVPTACDSVAPTQQLRVDAACPARRGASGSALEPAPIDYALAARLAAGTDRQLLRDWSGALVALDQVSAQQDADDGDAVFPFGVIRLEQTPLELHSRLYYFDLSEGGPRADGKAPHFSYPARFTRVVGLILLDYCSWVLAPRDRCADLAPASDGCAPARP